LAAQTRGHWVAGSSPAMVMGDGDYFDYRLFHRHGDAAQQLLFHALQPADDAATMDGAGVRVGDEIIAMQIGASQPHNVSRTGGFQKPFQLLDHALVRTPTFRFIWAVQANHFS
jgi:hypothetical protein